MKIFNRFISEDLLPSICVMTSTLVIGNWSKVRNQTIIYKRRQSGDCQSLCQRHLDVLVKRLYLDVPTHLAQVFGGGGRLGKGGGKDGDDDDVRSQVGI